MAQPGILDDVEALLAVERLMGDVVWYYPEHALGRWRYATSEELERAVLTELEKR